MLQFIRAAAIAASLVVVPAAVLSQDKAASTPSTSSAAVPAVAGRDRVRVVAPPSARRSLPTSAVAPDPTVDHEAAHRHDSGLAPGQTYADYRAWLGRSPAHRAEVAAFRAELTREGVDGIVPVWQLIRTSSSWRQCAAEPFEVAPRDKWVHIVETLKFVRDQVVPAVGEVEALSAYRNEGLNRCSAGAPRSAHRLFFALDLTPVNAAVTRDAMIRDVCRAHARVGRTYDAGLGFYSGRRFHVDSNGFRKWGPDGRGATSPCVRYS
jgi:hypothetical protein